MVFAALGDETRLRIVEQLVASGFSSPARLAKDLHVSRQAITKHLEKLERVGFVTCRRRGRKRRVWEMHMELIEWMGAYSGSLLETWAETLRRRQAAHALLDRAQELAMTLALQRGRFVAE